MLDEKRIKEAENKVRRYLDEGLLKKSYNEAAFLKYLENSELSLETAQRLFDSENSKYHPSLWVIVTSYYSMFYIANAVLTKLGYKVGDHGSHSVTSDALIVFIRNKLKKELLEEYEDTQNDALELTDNIIGLYDLELDKRSRFQYRMDEEIKRGKAITSLERAKRFVYEMKKLL